jgi:energy-coupling factor transporter ATP-binding protein EcfA2
VSRSNSQCSMHVKASQRSEVTPQPSGCPIQISRTRKLEGVSPIVLIGPNGSGKTRHAIEMANWNAADLVPALRNISLPADVPMRSFSQATTELQNHLDRRRKRPWELSGEINDLFSKLMAEDSAAATKFRDQFIAGAGGVPEQTKLMQLQRSWVRLFPGRAIEFSGHRPMVSSEYAQSHKEYPAQQMSDGERVALYLAGRVLDCSSTVLIVDEPEVHFHSRLGTRFWNDMEQMRPDVRFVYVTHDLPFALSRVGAQFVVIKPGEEPTIVSLESGLPSDLAQSLLAAASFSIYASRIIFCEGTEGSSMDQALYSAWFRSRDTAVVPVESSKYVVQCSKAFGLDNLVTGLTAEGIVDRDYWPQEHLDGLPSTTHVLDVHEVENLFCMRSVFEAVGQHLGLTGIGEKYAEFLAGARGLFGEEFLSHEVMERVKRRCEHEFRLALGALSGKAESSAIEEKLSPSSWGAPVARIMKEERERIQVALTGDEKSFNRCMPGKAFWKKAAEALGVKPDRYLSLVCSALNAEDGHELAGLGAALERALAPLLPARTVHAADAQSSPE